MNRTNRVVRGIWLFGFIACFASNAASDEAVAERPNVIVVMTDDQGYPELYMAIQFYKPLTSTRCTMRVCD